MKRLCSLGTSALLILLFSCAASAHCEIPCGIYGDDARFTALSEDLTTIEKSMKMIVELSADPDKHANQLVRWVANKEKHADHVREVVTQYFFAQRVKVPAEADGAVYDSYTRQLVVLHQMIVAAMKCKQTTDLAHVESLHRLIHDFRELYSK